MTHVENAMYSPDDYSYYLGNSLTIFETYEKIELLPSGLQINYFEFWTMFKPQIQGEMSDQFLIKISSTMKHVKIYTSICIKDVSQNQPWHLALWF